MDKQIQADFLRKRMVQLREKNGKSQSDMAKALKLNKSILSRVESGASSYKTILIYAEEYCNELGLTEDQKKAFFRGERVAVPDTSALLKKPQLIDELCEEYSQVIVPDIVISELDNIKDHNIGGQAPLAWQIIKGIGNNPNVTTRNCPSDNTNGKNNDEKIIFIAKEASKEFNCQVDIITYDAGFAARLNGNDEITAIFLESYNATKQNLVNTDSIKKINDYYADSYEDIEKQIGVETPDENDINSFLSNGYTLIISVVRNRNKPFNQRKEKIKWLIANGADVNKRDNSRYNFPALTHCVQNGDFEMFKFLLHECNANPNVGSRNPYDAGKLRQKNDGNMPLMVAAWHGKTEFVKELCADERTSLNQQDGNGFTALIKACHNGRTECRDILIKAGADPKIVDRDGYTAKERYQEYLEIGFERQNKYQKKYNNRLGEG